MTYDEALAFINQNPGKAARRESWPDEDQCIWFDGNHVVLFRTGIGTRGTAWPVDAAEGDLTAEDWITDEE